MNKRQRVEAVLAGRRPDHPPVSFWYHFPPDQATGQAAIDAHLALLDKYDLDFLKVMNDHEYPRSEVEVIHTAADLSKIKTLPGDTGELGEQLKVVRAITARLGKDVLTCTTIFNPWTVLRKLVAPLNRVHMPPRMDGTDERDEVLSRLLKEDRSAVQAAVLAIAGTLTNFARLCIEAEASGIFLSVRDDWVDRKENGEHTYEEIVRPADRQILAAVQNASFNVLHICGRALHFEAFADYPVHVINWADRSAGPSIAYARDRVKPAIAGGVDNLKTLREGIPADCAAEVRDALHQAKDRPIMITPGCTFDPQAVPPENLRAIVDAARNIASE